MKNIYVSFNEKVVGEKIFDYLKNYFNNISVDNTGFSAESIVITDIIFFRENSQQLKNTQVILLCELSEGLEIADLTHVLPLNIPIKMDDLISILEQKNFATTNIYKYKNYTLNLNDNVLLKGDTSINLSEKEALVLKEFFCNPNAILPKEYFLKTVWNISNMEVNSQSLESYVSALRKKFQENNVDLIITKEKDGYIII
ncbi:MAG: winged helix-turn-helix domain-containing protein [Alphaproteobacteria bacterium]|nr:winged helix-turn-helix domain-containing protein [Alphaproteobacteria bacterium]